LTLISRSGIGIVEMLAGHGRAVRVTVSPTLASAPCLPA
jgi:hypothetical protein